MALLYIILGTSGSGRREVIVDLLRNGIDLQSNLATVYTPEGETSCDVDETLMSLNNVTVNKWKLLDERYVITTSPEENQEAIFYLVDGQLSPIDQIQAIHDWAKQEGNIEIGRIYTIINSQLASTISRIKVWYDACIHFSDVVLFNKRENISNKWFKDFEAGYHSLCYPCLFDIVKKGRVKNAPSLLFPEARRLTQAFDDLDPNFQDPTYGYDIDTSEDDFEDDEFSIPSEAYFERMESGHRTKRIPDINRILGEK